MPKLSYYQKKGKLVSMELMEGEKPRKKVLEIVRAIEMHMVLYSNRMGIPQSLSIYFTSRVSSG